MALTPMDIHHKEFRNARFGGYNEDDVDSFLDQVADTFEKLIGRNKELEKQAEALKAQVSEFEGIEGSLRKALLTAAKSAEQVRAEAEEEARAMLVKTKEKAEEILGAAQHDRDDWENTMANMKDIKRDYIQSLQDLAESLLAKIEELRSEEEGLEPVDREEVSSDTGEAEEPTVEDEVKVEEVQVEEQTITGPPTVGEVKEVEEIAEERQLEAEEEVEEEEEEVVEEELGEEALQMESEPESINESSEDMRLEDVESPLVESDGDVEQIRTVVIKKNRDTGTDIEVSSSKGSGEQKKVRGRDVTSADEEGKTEKPSLDRRQGTATPASSLVDDVLGAVSGELTEPMREERQERLIRESKAMRRDDEVTGEKDRGQGTSRDYFWE